ncbi:3-hydroxyisobutyryl-CoA hydrolase, mitochondrial-like [Aphidius gifuensis]|uniref:3-hydroxyisobutyryl-CoA hydrolase, mitochondrial-like n=1 Tax=Aphidius gifuensis TaxID=684658 RepID=UPI001CDC068A|nr:3-hydroxyisobutyryl-CoA hydrolase, mitochondrial-like [Aphidius gifuensis]
MGVSMGIFFHGKYSVATETTQCGVPEVLIGLAPGFGASNLFQKKLKGQLGLYLSLTGRSLKGVDVKLTGIATHYVSSSKLPEVTKALLAPGDGDVKKILDEYDEQDPHAESCLSKYTKQLDECFSGDSVEDIIQRLKNDYSEWSKGVLKILDKISPTSLKVTKKAFEKGKELGLVDSLKMEFIVAQNIIIKKSDFEESVRAQIIDKDYKPNWNPPTLDQVSDKYVESKFIRSSENQPMINFDNLRINN